MADEMNVVHLWRSIDTPPYFRWACDVIGDASSEDGFRVVDHDPDVADTVFMHRLARAFHREYLTMEYVEGRGGVHADCGSVIRPHDDGYFEEAIMMVPQAVIRPAGRAK